jgi:hypothetical protein
VPKVEILQRPMPAANEGRHRDHRCHYTSKNVAFEMSQIRGGELFVSAPKFIALSGEPKTGRGPQLAIRRPPVPVGPAPRFRAAQGCASAEPCPCS